MSEAGLSGFEADNWNALLAPRGTPQNIIDRLNRELESVLGEKDTQALLIGTGAMAAYSTSQALASRIKSETVKWSKIAQAAGVKPE